jgi:hexokinase
MVHRRSTIAEVDDVKTSMSGAIKDQVRRSTFRRLQRAPPENRTAFLLWRVCESIVEQAARLFV